MGFQKRDDCAIGGFLPRTQIDLYVSRSTPQNKAFSKRNKGHLGCRYLHRWLISMENS